MNEYKIVILNSSPKAEKGNTHVIVESFMDGARSAGAEAENIFLAKYKIQPCIACMSCWFKTPGKCVLQDDADMILEKMSELCPSQLKSLTGLLLRIYL